MYYTEKDHKNGDYLYGIADENGLIVSFTSDFEAAEKVATLFNELDVERCHVTEIIKDMYHA